MDQMKVKELMRPSDEFPKISNQATFMEAVGVLDKSQQDFSSGKAKRNRSRGQTISYMLFHSKESTV